jgi:C1A family cysteine protease
MRSSFVVASVLVCVALVGCKKGKNDKKDDPASLTSAAVKPSASPGTDPSAAPSAAKTSTDPGKASHHARAITVAFGQKPPKPEKMAAPKVPELPELAKQEKANPPAKLPAGEYACGAAHSGKEDFPLMCIEEKNHEKEEKTARVLIPYGHLRGKLHPLPKVVDHREEQTEAEVRNQGTAGTCTSFGTAGAIDHSVTRWTGTASRVSVMELWARYHQPDLTDALIASVGQTLASEDAWPYDPKVAWPWRACPKAGGKSEGPCGKPVDKAKLDEVSKHPAVMVEQVEWLPKDFEIMRQKIAGGEDPIFAIKLPRHFAPVGAVGAKYIPDYKEEAGGHALSLAGYAIGEKGDNYYLVHNSWGPTWGDGGYAWIHEATLAKHMMNGFGIVDARPINGEKAHREGKTCPAGHAPDSLTGACEAECKEGGPMHNGVCPELSDCPTGFVNLFGECVGAAPTDSSKDEKTGVSWKCGPGGCAYTLPKALGKCEKEPCVLSCPAPSFRAAKDDHGLTCVE